MSDIYYPHIFLPVDSWAYNVSSHDPRDDQIVTVTPVLILHGKTQVWGKHDDEVPFELEIYRTGKQAIPFGYLIPMHHPSSEGGNSPSLSAYLSIDEKSFEDLRMCLLGGIRADHIGVKMILNVDGLEMVGREYHWPNGKKLGIVNWLYSLQYANVKNGM